MRGDTSLTGTDLSNELGGFADSTIPSSPALPCAVRALAQQPRLEAVPTVVGHVSVGIWELPRSMSLMPRRSTLPLHVEASCPLLPPEIAALMPCNSARNSFTSRCSCCSIPSPRAEPPTPFFAAITCNSAALALVRLSFTTAGGNCRSCFNPVAVMLGGDSER